MRSIIWSLFVFYCLCTSAHSWTIFRPRSRAVPHGRPVKLDDLNRRTVNKPPVANPIRLDDFNKRSAGAANLYDAANDRLRPKQVGAQEPLVLHPISVEDNWEPEVYRRAEGGEAAYHKAYEAKLQDFSRLELKDEAKMIYGAPQDGGTFFLANMTLKSHDGTPIVMMERFERLTSSMTCDELGNITLAFSSKAAMDYAIKVWDWINEDEDKHFLMITNSDSCGPEMQRAPYYIYNVDYDEKNNIAYLNGFEHQWSDTAHTFDVDFGKSEVSTATLRRRFWPFTPATFDKTVTLDITTERKPVLNVFTDNMRAVPRFKVDCLDCYLAGKFRLAGHLKVKGFKVKEMTYDVNPEDVSARVELNVRLEDYIDGPGWTFTQPIIEMPLGGIVIPMIFSAGPKLMYEVGVSTSIGGSVNMTFGVNTVLPNDAWIHGDLLDHDKSDYALLDKAQLDPIPFDVRNGFVSVDISAFTQPVLWLGFDILGLVGFQTSLRMRVPVVNLNATALYDDEGVCGEGRNGTKTAVEIKSAIGFDAFFEVGTPKHDHLIYQKRFFKWSYPLLDLCFPVHNVPISPKFARLEP